MTFEIFSMAILTFLLHSFFNCKVGRNLIFKEIITGKIHIDRTFEKNSLGHHWWNSKLISKCDNI